MPTLETTLNSDSVHALMERLAQQHGKDGMQAIAALMRGLGGGTFIAFPDDSWLPCDFLMQHAWELGGEP